MEFSGKVVIVTGAASGIGLALVKRFVQEGASVVASDLNAEAGAARAQELGVRFVQADVGHEAGVKALVDDVLAREGRVDVLCSNAGLVAGNGLEPEDRLWDLSYRVNFMSHVWGAVRAAAHARARVGRAAANRVGGGPADRSAFRALRRA